MAENLDDFKMEDEEMNAAAGGSYIGSDGKTYSDDGTLIVFAYNNCNEGRWGSGSAEICTNCLYSATSGLTVYCTKRHDPNFLGAPDDGGIGSLSPA